MIYFVTGGSRGIGAAIVLGAVREGHDVAFTYRGAADKAQAVIEQAATIDGARKVRAYALDVKDSAQVERVVDQVLEDFETVQVVVNNAGISRDNLVASMSDEEWNEVLATNLSGAFYVCRQFLPTLISNRFGRIINIASVAAGGMSGMANYAASKAGLIALTKSLAKEYGRRGITANVVVPGFFETDMTQERMTERTREFWQQFAPVPNGRKGNLDELAHAVTFLASEKAAYINGEELHITGGLDWGP